MLPPYEWFQWCTFDWVGSISTEAVFDMCLFPHYCFVGVTVFVFWHGIVFVCVCAWVGYGCSEDVCVGVGEGGTALQPDILGTAGWRCWPTCSLLSSAGSSRISAAASPHKATLCNLPRAHKYNCNQERREEGGGKMGQCRQKEEKGSDCSGLCAPVSLEDDNVSLSIFKSHALLPAKIPLTHT